LKNYLSTGDFLDLLLKLYEKGPGNLLRKLDPRSARRTHSAFNRGIVSSNWWIIPEVKERWNKLITGDASKPYEHLVIEYLEDRSSLRLLSIGCGVASHEIQLAGSGLFQKVKGVDLANNLIEQANKNSEDLGLGEICEFECRNILDKPLSGTYDIILFHSSLHHFNNIDQFISQSLIPLLSSDGILVINEYVGPTRLQWTDKQLNVANSALKTIPKDWRRTRLPGYTKNRIHRPGLWRMILADPSEAVDSQSIRMAIANHFTVELEREYGGNLLHLILKDIAHNFIQEGQDHDRLKVLNDLFALEDQFMEEEDSDFLFGIYKRRS